MAKRPTGSAPTVTLSRVKDSVTGDPDLLLPSETAQLLRLSEGSLANMRSGGYGPPYVKIGNRAVRYSRRALAEWLVAQSGPGGAA
jgi:predicted DNA-binding transcriptional regulator AlpA